MNSSFLVNSIIWDLFQFLNGMTLHGLTFICIICIMYIHDKLSLKLLSLVYEVFEV